MAVVDASVYVALINHREASHADSWDWLREVVARGEEIAAPAILVTEVAAAISRGLEEPTLAWRAVQQILSRNLVELVPVVTPMAGRAADIAIDHRIRGADALYVALAERRKDELVTLDRQQLERGAAVVPTRRPGDGSARRPHERTSRRPQSFDL